MSIFTIADTHLSLSDDKPMDIFGDNWAGHTEKIEKNWKEIVKKLEEIGYNGLYSSEILFNTSDELFENANAFDNVLKRG